MTESARRDPTGRAGPLLLALASVLAVFYPTCTDQGDSFPLSTYPMFAHPRGQPEVVQLVAITDSGERIPVPPHLVGSSEVLQAKVLLARVAHARKGTRQKFCKRVAKRVQEAGTYGTWSRLELVRARFDPLTYFLEERRPISQKRLVHCRVQQPTSRLDAVTLGARPW